MAKRTTSVYLMPDETKPNINVPRNNRDTPKKVTREKERAKEQPQIINDQWIRLPGEGRSDYGIYEVDLAAAMEEKEKTKLQEKGEQSGEESSDSSESSSLSEKETVDAAAIEREQLKSRREMLPSEPTQDSCIAIREPSANRYQTPSPNIRSPTTSPHPLIVDRAAECPESPLMETKEEPVIQRHRPTLRRRAQSERVIEPKRPPMRSGNPILDEEYFQRPKNIAHQRSPMQRIRDRWSSHRRAKTPTTPKTRIGSIEVATFKSIVPDEKTSDPDAMYMVRTKILSAYNPLKSDPFFHGLLPKEELERMLVKNGDFLTRDTERTIQGKQTLVPTLSVRWNRDVKHFLIGRTRKGKYHIGGNLFDNVIDLIDWHRMSMCPLSQESGVILRTAVNRQLWQFSHDQVRLISKLGEGAFGEVHRGVVIDKSESIEVAIKIQHQRPTVTSRQDRCKFLEEFKVMRKFDHPNVVKVLGVAALKEPMMIIMEYLPGGSLVHFLRQQRIHIRLVDRVRFCTEAAAGLRYLESRKCLHRDIAARNCLMGSRKELKIADFGLSMFDVNSFKESKGQKMPIKWLSPETLRIGTFSPETDIWSFGILMWEIFADGREPYPKMTNSQVKEKVNYNHYRMASPMGTPNQISQLINGCWNEIPEKRPKFYQIHRKLSSFYKSLR